MAETSAKVPRWLRILIPLVLIFMWLGISGVGGPYFGKIEEVSTNNLTDFLPNSADSTKVQNRVADFASSDTIPAILVFERSTGVTREDKTAIGSFVESLKGQEGLVDPLQTPVIPSEDGKAVQLIFRIDRNAEIDLAVAGLRDKVSEVNRDGLKGYVTGPAGFSTDLTKAFGGIDGILLVVALAVVFVILLIVYRSPSLPFIVLATSMFALSASILLVYYLAKNDIVTLNGQVQGILSILVIGAATDYSLLYVSRYREELQRTTDKWRATKNALKGSFEPIIASGGTVIAGLLCLLLSDLDSNKALGPVGSVGIAISMLSALTFLPAALYLTGRGAFWPFRPKYDKTIAAEDLYKQHGRWAKLAHMVDRHARPVWVITLVLLGVGAYGLTQLKAEGIQQSEIILSASEARDGQDALSRHFPGGSGSPVLIITSEANEDAVSKVVTETKGVDSVTSVSAAGFGAFAPGLPTKVVNGDVMLQAVLTDEPDSARAEATVETIREKTKQIDGSTIVGGETATALDTNQTSIRDRMIIIPTVLAAIFVILIFLLRSLIAPLLLIATTALSFAAALGISAFVFNNLFGFPGADASVPLYCFVFLVALGIDYNIFLMTRVREETLKSGVREGVIRGLAVTGGVITSAGIVLAATFAALSVIPILFLAQIAFTVAFGVLLDTIVVRSLLVPALIIDIGKFSWWPSKLSK